MALDSRWEVDREVLLAPQSFRRQDESDDALFYQLPRLVVHIDEDAIAAVGEVFRRLISPNSVVLDLLSSWRSHWPEGFPKARMVGLGLSAAEMADNPDLDDYVVHDLNRDPTLPLDDASFDAVVITVSMQYLVRPIEVFRQVNRILRPGGVFLVIFSNRMFPTKAVWIWTMCTDQQRARMIATYMEEAGSYADIQGLYVPPQAGPGGDPIYAVAARKCQSSDAVS